MPETITSLGLLDVSANLLNPAEVGALLLTMERTPISTPP